MKKYTRTAQLFDYQTMASGTVRAYLLSDGSLRSEGSWTITDYIPCDGTNFVLNKIGGNAPSICFYDSNKDYISGQGYNTGGASIKSIIYATAASNAKYIRFSYMTSTNPDDLTQIMLNEGSMALPYEPYGSTWQTKSPPNYGTATDTVTNLPVTLYTDGQPVSSYTLKGNTTTSGTPSPSNPITIEGVGDLVTSGEHAGQYEISISSNQQVLTPVYLSNQLMKIGNTVDTLASSGTVTYNIKKLVLTGEETCYPYSYQSTNGIEMIGMLDVNYQRTNGICSHYPVATTGSANSLWIGVNNKTLYFVGILDDLGLSSSTAFKQWLATQYANGTPVTVYYVLATAQTESVTAPEITTTGGEVTLDTNTTVKPSEFSLTYHGWHSHEPLKRENGQWV